MNPKRENAPQAPLDPSPTMPVQDALDAAIRLYNSKSQEAIRWGSPEERRQAEETRDTLTALADALPSDETLTACEEILDGLTWDECSDESLADLARFRGELRRLAEVLGEGPRS